MHLGTKQDEKQPEPAKKRCTVYIDGFNTYYGLFKDNPALKWFNFQSFFESLLSHDEVVRIRYFTARLLRNAHGESTYQRQDHYLLALARQPKIKITMGNYREREVRCKAICREGYLAPEEKKTDVNIAVKIIGDAPDPVGDPETGR